MKKITLLFISLFSFQAIAAEVPSSTIENLMLDRHHHGKAFIKLRDRQGTPISCHTNTNWEFIMDITDEQGKAMYAMLLALKASQQPARFYGDSNCSLYHNIETLRRIEAH